mgnify:CR=1 FL=1
MTDIQDNISLDQFNDILNQPLPEGFTMPKGNEIDWKAIDHQRAANVYYIKLGRIDKRYPNYKPTQSLLESSFNRHTRLARQKRQQEKS